MPSGAAIKIRVELFGLPRLRCGRREVELTLPLNSDRRQLVSALAQACPGLVGHGLRPDLADLDEGYVFNRNGVTFLRAGEMDLADGDALLLISSQAGG